jgi:fumarate hydratase subunit alpha
MGTVSVIRAEAVARAVADLYGSISTNLRPDVVAALEAALEGETSDTGREVLRELLENAAVSRDSGIPLCQDTGALVAFVELGSRVVLDAGTVQAAVDEGVRSAARRVPLRTSMVSDPIGRRNTGDNTPAIVHVELVEGDTLTVRLLAKGGGAENTSRVAMLTPAEGRKGVVRTIVETVSAAGAGACPPVVVGVGLGGNFERSAVLAKRALLRDLAQPNPDARLAEIEREALEAVNDLGIGPQGFGGRTTALAVLIAAAPCHIASLPVAVNVECHSHRHGSITLKGTPPDGG